jgi:rod shape-determining protein MreD
VDRAVSELTLPMLVVRSSFVLFVALVLQTGVLPDMRVAGAQADLMLLVGIAAGIVSGPERGAAYGFAAGMAYDVVLHTPLGLSALVYSIVGYVAGLGRDSMLRTAWWIPVATAATCSALGVALYVVCGTVLGRSTAGLPLTTIGLVVAAVNALLALPAVRVLRWCTGDGDLGHRRPVMR